MLMSSAIGIGVFSSSNSSVVSAREKKEYFVYGVDYIDLVNIDFQSKNVTYDLGDPSKKVSRIDLIGSFSYLQLLDFGLVSIGGGNVVFGKQYYYTNLDSFHYLNGNTFNSALSIELHDLNEDEYVLSSASPYVGGSWLQSPYIDGMPYMPTKFTNTHGYDDTYLLSSGAFYNSFNTWFPFARLGSYATSGINLNNQVEITISFYRPNTTFDGDYDGLLSGVWFGNYDYFLYKIGNFDNVDFAYNNGFVEGEKVGYDNGYADGLDDGYTSGLDYGYTSGYYDGVENTELSGTLIGNVIFSTIGSLASFIVTVSSFEVMGLSIGSMVAFLISVGLIILILGMVKK